MRKVDRNSFEPSYAQLVRILQEEIETGRLRPGDRLPSESQLCAHHGVSHMTIRRAINILVEQGVILTEQGRGTFVKPMQFWGATFNLGRLRNLFSGGKDTKIKILEASIKQANERVAHKMLVKKGQRILYIRRLITWQDKPIMYHREYLLYDPSRPIVESELDVTSLKGVFEGTGNSFIKYGMLSIEATVLKSTEARQLQTRTSSAAFYLEHLFYDFEDRPVSWGWFICPADKLKFTTVIGARDEERQQP
ncbi:MAG: GntR family transcriptional regulator [Dehalococcoidia bacterium]|jgi:DNA-binding GntR family transcriptional regulator